MSPGEAPRGLPPLVFTLAEAVAQAGGRAYVVGGWVRDLHLGLPCKDIDVEVHGLPEAALEVLLGRLGRVNAVGRSFGVFKLSAPGVELDVSLPRRDSKVGPGHRGIAVEGDPQMGVVEAARRRDLTVNALLYDPLTRQTLDPFGGLQDLADRLLREVDPRTFEEDPLRALRAVQFAARFGFTLAPSLAALCRAAPLGELPVERVRGELDKLLLKAPRPSVGLRWLSELGLAAQVLPELAPHLDAAREAAVDRAAAHREALDGEGERLALMLGALLHPLEPIQVERSLDRLGVHTVLRHPTRAVILDLLRRVPHQPPDDAALRALADRVPVGLLLRLADALHPGQGFPAALERARALGVEVGPLPRLVQGADLHALGVPQGPRMGALLAQLRREQHQGRLATREQALARAAGLARVGGGDPGLESLYSPGVQAPGTHDADP